MNMNFVSKVAFETSEGIIGLWCGQQKNGIKIFYPLGMEISDEIIMNELGAVIISKGRYYLEDGIYAIKEDQHMYCYNLYTIENEKLKSNYCGHMQTNTIYLDLENDADVLGNYDKYKGKFLDLFAKIASLANEVYAVNIQYENINLTPDMLEKCGYSLRYWKNYENMYCFTEDQVHQVILEKSKEWMPWSAIMRYKFYYKRADDDLKKIWELMQMFACK